MSTVFDLGPFRLDADAGVLTHAGVPVALGARAVAVLNVLVEHANAFVAKDTIFDAAWPGLVVEENNLAVQISAIRRVLAQAVGGDRWIETLSRRGYRYVGPLAVDAPAVDTAAVRSNLPEPSTSFVGRERELVEAKRLLPRTRLLTLVGPGGTGKTRLALQLAAEVVDAYRDGVRFVDLAPIVDASLVPTALAHALGLREQPATPLPDSIATFLRGRELMLVIDNCEHVLDACAHLVDTLVRTVAGPTIVATSREPLDIAGEQTYPVPTLSLPDPSDSDGASRSEAVQLFVERARSQQPSFELTPERAAVIAQICVRLDGIPLAIELAAARVRALTVDEINERLSDRFALLAGGARTALPRQRTLRATLDWSHDLLPDPMRAVFRRLAIFAGPFTLDAAAGVASDDAIDASTADEIVMQLAARSMVVVDTSGELARYRLLETTRAYAMEKLRDAGEVDALAGRHASNLCERFERHPPAWLQLPDAAWRSDCLPELDNVRAALDWTIALAHDPALGIRLASASAAIWPIMSLQREGRRRLEAAVEHMNAETPQPEQARLWLWVGLMRAMESPAESTFAFERAVELYRALGDSTALGYALLRLGGRLARIGRTADAEPILAQAQPLLERADSPKLLADCLTAFGFLRLQLGDLAGARDAYQRAVPLFERSGGVDQVLNLTGNLADVSWALGDMEAAEAGYREAIRMARTIPHAEDRIRGVHLTALAGLLAVRGELVASLAVAREGLPLLERSGCAWYNLDYLALRAALAGKLGNAARIAGYQDAAFAAKATVRQVLEARAREHVQTLLREGLAADDLARLLAEGAKLAEHEVCRLALEE